MKRKSRQSKRKSEIVKNKKNQQIFERRLRRIEEALGSASKKKRHGASNLVLKGIWLGVQVASNSITIWQSLNGVFKSVLESSLNNILSRFMMSASTMPMDEQVVQAAKLISVLRAMEKVLGETKAPDFSNSLTKDVMAIELANAFIDALSVSKENFSEIFLVLREKWELDSTLALASKRR